MEVSTRIFWHPQKQEEKTQDIVLVGTNKQVEYKGIKYVTNSLGLRNEEINFKKQNNEYRILLLGDSFVWGSGLRKKNLISTKLAELLKTPSTQFTVINGGISNMNTTDEYLQLKLLSKNYDPDFIILFFFTNDVLERDQSGKTKKMTSFRQRIKEYLRSKSRFAALTYYLYKAKMVSNIGSPKFLLPSDYFNLDESKPGWTAFKEATMNIHRYCVNHGLNFIFVMIPTLTSLDKNYPYHELRKKTKLFLNNNRITHIDLFDAFSIFEPVELWVSPLNSHWNGTATTIAAHTIIDSIKVNFDILNY